MGHGRGSYEADVFADSADEAIAIAAEALPPGAEVTDARALPHPDNDGWRVTLTFRGGKKKAPPA